MKPFVRSILFTGILAIVAISSMVAQTSNGWFEQWYRAKYGRPSPTEEARLETKQVNSASPEATPSTLATSARQRSLTEQASLGQIPAKEHLSKHQLNTLIATAKTPADHQRIAQFYQAQAQDYLAQSKEHAREAEQSRNDP